MKSLPFAVTRITYDWNTCLTLSRTEADRRTFTAPTSARYVLTSWWAQVQGGAASNLLQAPPYQPLRRLLIQLFKAGAKVYDENNGVKKVLFLSKRKGIQKKFLSRWKIIIESFAVKNK